MSDVLRSSNTKHGMILGKTDAQVRKLVKNYDKAIVRLSRGDANTEED